MIIKPESPKMALPLVAARLEALRLATGLLKGEFADSIGVDRSSYSKILNAEKPLKVEMGYAVSERWGVPMDFLYRGHLLNLPDQYDKAIIAALTTTSR